MSKLSVGLNLSKASTSSNSKPAPAKRKAIFGDDDDDDNEDNEGLADNSANGGKKPQGLKGSTSGGLKFSLSKSTSKPSLTGKPPSNPSLTQHATKPPLASSRPQDSTNLSVKRTAALHTQAAQSLDPSIYDYDAVYDSLHAKPPPKPSSSSAKDGGDGGGSSSTTKPKYMTSLLAASETRKRDLLRAKEKLLAREREAEGDAFADKEAFVTGAYKRQQEALRKEEEEEVRKEEEERRRRDKGEGGMKGVYRGMLDREEERHRAVMEAVDRKKEEKEEAKRDMDEATLNAAGKTDDDTAEIDLAKQRGATINEDGEVVDKRELLSAGLNAVGGAARAKPRPRPKPSSNGREQQGGRKRGREDDSKSFEDALLGDLGESSGDDDEEEQREDDGARASKSRRLEDQLLAGLGSP